MAKQRLEPGGYSFSFAAGPRGLRSFTTLFKTPYLLALTRRLFDSRLRRTCAIPIDRAIQTEAWLIGGVRITRSEGIAPRSSP